MLQSMRSLVLVAALLTLYAAFGTEVEHYPPKLSQQFAVREKKSIAEEAYALNDDAAAGPFLVPSDLQKRKSFGFMGVRGKKLAWEGSYPDEYRKRIPSGFVGVRGKKDDYYADAEKRRMGFMGMRGKKAKMGFFGMRGKKFPLRGKFVGVRGKKQSDEVIWPEQINPEDLNLNQLLLLLTENNLEFDQENNDIGSLAE